MNGQVLARADSAYYGHAFVSCALRHGAWFSVTARMNPKVTAAIAFIDEHAWQAIRCPQAIWEEAEQCWVSDGPDGRGPLRGIHRTPQG